MYFATRELIAVVVSARAVASSFSIFCSPLALPVMIS